MQSAFLLAATAAEAIAPLILLTSGICWVVILIAMARGKGPI